jgi:hypothetical protein
MFDDFKELLSAFNAHNVKYLVVGGYAVSFHSQPRATKDLDIFIKADPTNANAAYEALARFGAPLVGIARSDLADPSKFIRFGRPPIAVDILSGIEGVDFDEAWERRVESVIDPATGLIAFFISKPDSGAESGDSNPNRIKRWMGHTPEPEPSRRRVHQRPQRTTIWVPGRTMVPAAGACSRTVPLPVICTARPAAAACSMTLRTGRPRSEGT